MASSKGKSKKKKAPTPMPDAFGGRSKKRKDIRTGKLPSLSKEEKAANAKRKPVASKLDEKK